MDGISNHNMKALAAPNLHETALQLLNQTGINHSIKILDAGCGEGAFIKKLLEKKYNVSACDIHPENFRLQGIKCKKVDLNGKLPYVNNEFDVIISLETIEHLEDPWNMIREIYRILKPGGFTLISTPNNEHILSRLTFALSGNFVYFWSKRYRQWNGHINPVFLWELEMILGKIGFTVLKKVYNEGKLFPIFKPFFQKGKLYFGSPISVSYLPKNSLFGENLIILAKKV